LLLREMPEEAIQDCLRETEIFLSIDHPHAVQLVDVYISDDTIDLVMECMEGGDLFERVNEKSFSEEEVADTMRQMLLALDYLHGRGIAHCDVKPQNFLFTEASGKQLKLGDFGFSQVCEPGQQLMRCSGTLTYAAPELLQGMYTSQVDMWALGVSAHELLLGQVPFAGSRDKCVQAIIAADWDRCQGWIGSSDALDFVDKLLVADPSVRLTASQALQHPWINRHQPAPHTVRVDESLLNSLKNFACSTPLHQTCVSAMMEGSQLREVLMPLVQSRCGTFCQSDLWKALHFADGAVCDDAIRGMFLALNNTGTGDI